MLDRNKVKQLRDKLQSILDVQPYFLDSYDLTVGNASFNDDEVTFKLSLRIKGASTQAEKDLEQWAEIHNLDLTKTARMDGKTFILSGYRRKARTKPYLMKDIASGVEYITTQDIAKTYFSKEKVMN
jgi:hypothetical protein